MRHVGPIAICSAIFITPAYAQSFPVFSSLDEMIEAAFRPSIVKVDVKSSSAVFDDRGVNICQSQGTGFLLNESHIATAEHVYKQLSADCGDPIIVIKSADINLQKVAQIVAAKDDVAVLKIEGQFPNSMCALRIRAGDVYAVQAIRYGIPGNLNDPLVTGGVKIGIKNSEFAPLTVITPAIVEKGESGGPIIFQMNVVGMTRARHEKYPAISFMTVAYALRDLMKSANVSTSGHVCDPSEGTGFFFDQPLRESKPNSDVTFRWWTTHRMDIKNIGSIVNSTTSFSVNPGAPSVSPLGNSVVNMDTVLPKIFIPKAPPNSLAKEDLWDRYVAAATKNGKWSNLWSQLSRQKIEVKKA